ncbi:hypothetical protein Droror1_Dr00013013 [Drosera rotundifolia]
MDDDSRNPLIRRAGGSNFIKACFNGTNVFLGIGLLTVSYALSSIGWLGLSLFFVVGVIAFYTGVLLTRCMDLSPSIQSYLDIAECAFGKTGRIMVIVIMNTELYLIGTGLLILEGDNLYKLFPKFMLSVGKLIIEGRRSFILITAIVVSPTMLLTDLGVLSFVSATGVFSCLIILVSVVSVAAFDGVGFHCGGELLKLGGIGTAVSLFIVCFAGHPVIPSIYISMKYPHQFVKVLFVSFIITTITYLGMAVSGYLMYGDNVDTQITLNLPTNSVATQVAIYTTLLIPVTRYALMMTPVASAIENGMPENYRHMTSFRIAIRLVLLVSTTTLAYAFPYYETLVSVVGSIFVVLASFLLPCLCYLKISGSYRQWSFDSIAGLGIIGFGTLAGLFGVYSSIAELANKDN